MIKKIYLPVLGYFLIVAAVYAGEIKFSADGPDLQGVIDAAQPYSIVICERNKPLTLSEPVIIRKPLTIRGINARLPEKLGKTSLLVIAAEGVTISDFELHGNYDTVPQTERAPLISISAGEFAIERGLFVNSSKDGIEVTARGGEDADIVGGVVRDIVGKGIGRDVVSISGGDLGQQIRNVLVENIRCYKSYYRGAVEVSDGSDNITVRKVYAEDSLYAIDVQDHGKPKQVNTNVVVQDVYAVRCKHAIRTANRPHGHANLTIRDVIAKECNAPIRISHTDGVILQNVRIFDHSDDNTPISVKNCVSVSIRDIALSNIAHNGEAILLQDCDETLIDGIALRDNTSTLASAILFRITSDRMFSGLRITNVLAPAAQMAGIILESQKGTLKDYVILGNLARVKDGIQGQGAIIAKNMP
ncbi:hypothetical protein ACFL6S_16360 [Candidatus Poribacteria bacterium]